MYRPDCGISTFACVVDLSAASRFHAQKKAIEPDLAALAEGKGLKVFNRSLSVINDGARKGVRLSESPGDGVAYLEGVEFTDGVIEFDIRGKDVHQQRIVGVVYQGVADQPYDGI